MSLRKNIRRHLDWPLLGKELLEQAARKQMYVIRVVYAIVLFGAFCIYYMRHLAAGPVLVLGQGWGPFSFLVSAQMFTIYLFLPPLMAGALAQEKERDTLGLLFLTDLTPWELILQKYFGRLIPMLTLLFLSLPLLAVSYSLGGVSRDLLYYSAVQLFLTCLWVGALGLYCSANQASTFQALVRCWGLCLALTLFCSMAAFPIWQIFPSTFASRGAVSSRWPSMFPSLAFSVVATLFFLGRARYDLERRAFAQRRNPFGQQFKQLDQYWKDLRKLLHALLKKRDPEAHELAQEVVRRQLEAAGGDAVGWSLGTFLFAKMQVPNVLSFAVIFGVIVLIALVTNVVLDPKSGGAFQVVVAGFWILALLTVPIQSANAVASERMNERLGPMLTTPLTAKEMLSEWLGPVQRWIQFLMRPLAIVIVVETIVKYSTQERGVPHWQAPAEYLVLGLATVLIYPALVQWFCLWIGLRIRSQIRALMIAFLLVAAWCFVPGVIAGFLAQTGLLSQDSSQILNYLSPVAVIHTVEIIGRRDSGVTWEMIILTIFHLGFAALAMGAIRWRCQTAADRYLGRI